MQGESGADQKPGGDIARTRTGLHWLVGLDFPHENLGDRVPDNHLLLDGSAGSCRISHQFWCHSASTGLHPAGAANQLLGWRMESMEFRMGWRILGAAHGDRFLR